MKYVYLFSEGNKDMREILGGKGANLCEMTKLGLPVPQGFIVSTEACTKYYNDDKKLDEKIISEIYKKISELERLSGKKFGSKENPLLLSIRSGSRASMPGMMDTILNLGLNDEIVESYKGENKRFIYDSYRRFISMFSDVVMNYDKSKFENALDRMKKKKNIKNDMDLTLEDMIKITNEFKIIYKEISGKDFPQDPKYQLIEAIKAVFRSWDNERANIYRRMNNIPYDWGTAVNVQEMVYGNLNENSGTGVAFSRNPSTGVNELYGEYLINAQGEDVVSGVRTPKPINTLKEIYPKIYDEFYNYAKILENHYKDMQDMEFTIENGKLYILQTRDGKRTAKASVKIAMDLLREKLITKEEAIMRVGPEQLEGLLHQTFDNNELKRAKVIAKGLAASPGAGYGKLYFNKDDVKKAKENMEDTILIRLETSPEDIEGMKNANAVITIRGGMTSHAAVVARGMGKCCVCGVSDLTIDEDKKIVYTKDGLIFKEGDVISVDGVTGNIYEGKLNTIQSDITGDFKEFMDIVDEFRNMKVLVNADTKADAINALRLGAEGIGLVRTEHMFFEKERIFNFRRMIISNNDNEREEALNKILPYQKEDFMELFRVMDGKKVVIRYLDPPLHEFLPKEDNEIKELSESLNISFEDAKQRIDSLKEFNPMMGHRGLRLDITYPSIAIMQTRAVIEASIECIKEGIDVKPDIMIPLTTDVKELRYVKELVIEEAQKIMNQNNIKVDYKIGTMIETPRAVIVSDELAKESDFFSFGTNDLTQLTFGFSRDDSGKFLKDYYDKKILEFDPFERIDENGVLRLVRIAKEKAKEENPKIELGVCGEHAGNSVSIELFNKIGLDYVSCSPYRIPCAKLAVARSNIKRA